MARRSSLASLVAAVLLAAAATLALPVGSAQAATCADGAGVSVLVDFGALGGGTATGCGGEKEVASEAFKAAGVTLAMHPRQQGFVCRVQGKPANGDCLRTDAYWGFFVSDDGQRWVYASRGVYQQRVASGQTVALVWQCSASRRLPGGASRCTKPTAAPSVAGSGKSTKRPQPKPTKRPTTRATTGAAVTPSTSSVPSATATSGAASPSVSASTSATTSSAADPTSAATSAATPVAPSSTPPTSAAASPSATTDLQPAAADDSGGLPGWLPPAIVVLLAAAGGGLAWARRGR